MSKNSVPKIYSVTYAAMLCVEFPQAQCIDLR